MPRNRSWQQKITDFAVGESVGDYAPLWQQLLREDVLAAVNTPRVPANARLEDTITRLNEWRQNALERCPSIEREHLSLNCKAFPAYAMKDNSEPVQLGDIIKRPLYGATVPERLEKLTDEFRVWFVSDIQPRDLVRKQQERQSAININEFAAAVNEEFLAVDHSPEATLRAMEELNAQLDAQEAAPVPMAEETRKRLREVSEQINNELQRLDVVWRGGEGTDVEVQLARTRERIEALLLARSSSVEPPEAATVDKRLPTSSYAPGATRSPRDLRVDVLFFVCEPNCAPLPEAQRELSAALEAVNAAGKRAVVQDHGGGADTLRDLLAKHRPRVLHFIGHIPPHAVTRELTLGLTHEDGGLVTIRPELIVDVLTSEAASSFLEVVVLNGCRSVGMAMKISDAGIPAVGWETLVADFAAAKFAPPFYAELLRLEASEPLQSLLRSATEQGVLAVRALHRSRANADGVRSDAWEVGSDPAAQGRLADGRNAAGVPVLKMPAATRAGAIPPAVPSAPTIPATPAARAHQPWLWLLAGGALAVAISADTLWLVPSSPAAAPNTELTLCGWSSCLSWDIHDTDSLQPGKCYRVDAKVGKDELKPVLQRGAHCGMSGVASIPDGYAVEVNGLEGSWPEGQEACRAPAARDKQKVTSPHCSSKTGCMENEGFGNNGSPGDWSRYCAFKLVPL